MITGNSQPLKSLPIIAIIGRPNVGKSSLFNCLTGKRFAITYEEAGTTRDSIYHRLEVDKGFFAVLVDTGGIESGKKEKLVSELNLLAAKQGELDKGYLALVLNEALPITTDEWFKTVYSQSDKLKAFYANYKKLKSLSP